jgi:hypothetical protein
VEVKLHWPAIVQQAAAGLAHGKGLGNKDAFMAKDSKRLKYIEIPGILKYIKYTVKCKVAIRGLPSVSGVLHVELVSEGDSPGCADVPSRFSP